MIPRSDTFLSKVHSYHTFCTHIYNPYVHFTSKKINIFTQKRQKTTWINNFNEKLKTSTPKLKHGEWNKTQSSRNSISWSLWTQSDVPAELKWTREANELPGGGDGGVACPPVGAAAGRRSDATQDLVLDNTFYSAQSDWIPPNATKNTGFILGLGDTAYRWRLRTFTNEGWKMCCTWLLIIKSL